jgi:hypothetical protein
MAALASAAPAALASPAATGSRLSAAISNPNVNVSPNPSAPGSSTTIVAICSSVTVNDSASSAVLSGTPVGLPAQIQMQPGTQADQFISTINLPQTVPPGTVSLQIQCSNGVQESATFVVNAVPRQAPQTGDGATSTATNGRLTVAGLGLLGVAAVVSGLVVRKRRSGRRA